MATKAEIEFKVYQGGSRIDSVTATTIVNDPEELLGKIKTQVRKAHPEIDTAKVKKEEKKIAEGVWYVQAEDDVSGKAFLLLISKL